MFASEAGLGPEIAELNGMSVREVLAEADLVLGGAATPFAVDDREPRERHERCLRRRHHEHFREVPCVSVLDGACPGALDVGDAADRLRGPRLCRLSGAAKRQRRRGALVEQHMYRVEYSDRKWRHKPLESLKTDSEMAPVPGLAEGLRPPARSAPRGPSPSPAEAGRR
jgi:hypothetical protein